MQEKGKMVSFLNLSKLNCFWAGWSFLELF